MDLAARQAAARRAKALRAGRTRRANLVAAEASGRLPFHHVIETVVSLGLVPKRFHAGLMRLCRGHSDPRAVLAALRLLNSRLSPSPRLHAGVQVVTGRVVGFEEFYLSFVDRHRAVVWLETDCGHSLYGTPPVHGLKVGDRLSFKCEVRPGAYKWWISAKCRPQDIVVEPAGATKSCG